MIPCVSVTKYSRPFILFQQKEAASDSPASPGISLPKKAECLKQPFYILFYLQFFPEQII